MERIAGYKAKNVGWCKFRKDPIVHIAENSFILWAVKGDIRDLKQRNDTSRFIF
mgnify:CR=1 FL=1